MGRPFLTVVFLLAAFGRAFAAQPVAPAIFPLDDLKPGLHGEVWTVFRGTEPEPFQVEVTGVVRNALGPGKSLILCQLTDPRVQNMGAVAGMSGSPLYIDGKLAGALSYQIQRFETVRYAGFTPAADLVEVQTKMAAALDAETARQPASAPISALRSPISDLRTPISSTPPASLSDFRPLRPVFTLSGLSPAVAELFAPRFAALGLAASSLGGSTLGAESSSQPSALSSQLSPGSAVAVALATGDITLAGTGTVSAIDGTSVTAFGHPMMSLGDVALPMCAAEIVTILPSSMQSIKIANTGRIIGTITQDRLSAVSGTLGAGPAMTEVEVIVNSAQKSRTLHFSVARQETLTPVLVATGVSQAILGSNDAGLSKGFILRSDIMYAAKPTLASRTLYAGPQGFQQGLQEFVQDLAQNLQNPYEKTFPGRVVFTVEALEQNPAITVELFQLSRTIARAGDTVQATLSWRDFQGDAHRQTFDIPVDAAWTGKSIEVILAPGRILDELAGRPRAVAAASLRSFDAYLAAMQDNRPADGLSLAVVEKTHLFTDQTNSTPDAPSSIGRIARAADEARFGELDAVAPLWEQHILAGKLAGLVLHRPLKVVE